MVVKHQDFTNSKLFVYKYSKNIIHKINHESKIIKIASLGQSIYFANEKNEIYKVDCKSGNYSQIISTNQKDNLPLNIPIKFFIGGYYHLIIILQNNQMFIHGSTNHSCVGEHVETEIETLKFMGLQKILNNNDYYKNNFEITHVCCGTYSTAIVINNKDIWFTGKIGEVVEKDFTKITTDKTFTIKRISCGYGHLIVVSNNGELFGFGKNHYGQLNGKSKDPLDIETFTKITIPFINNNNYILDAFAFPLSHFSVIIDKFNDIYLFGFFGDELGKSLTNTLSFDRGIVKLNHLIFKIPISKEINESTSFNITDDSNIIDNELNNEDNENWNYNYQKKELLIYGAFSSLMLVDNLQRNIWLGGKRGNHFTNERIYLQEIDNTLFSNPNEQVLDIACGSSVSGILIGSVSLINIYMLNNLKKMARLCCNRVENNNFVSLSDIYIKMY